MKRSSESVRILFYHRNLQIVVDVIFHRQIKSLLRYCLDIGAQ